MLFRSANGHVLRCGRVLVRDVQGTKWVGKSTGVLSVANGVYVTRFGMLGKWRKVGSNRRCMVAGMGVLCPILAKSRDNAAGLS